MDAGLSGWLIFRFAPVGLFSLKMSRATSTSGKTLLVPTPYAAKMAFVDAALRNRATESPDGLVRALAKTSLRIGTPQHACVTATIQSIRQETRDEDLKRHPDLPRYRANVAMRELVHLHGTLSLALGLGSPELAALVTRIAPTINYLGKRGSFVQFLGTALADSLDSTFTRPVTEADALVPGSGQRAMLDDFGPGATFSALNSFSATKIQRGVHRVFVDTVIPLHLYNSGPGFYHYRARK
jgi:hypothetical protein